MFEITDTLKRLNLQYGEDSAMDYKYIKKSLCHDTNKYTHWKLPTQTWEDYFANLRGIDDAIYIDCRIAIEMVQLFNDEDSNKNNLFTIEFPYSGQKRDHEEYIFVGDRFDVALSPYIDSHPGIWIVPSKNKGMYIGLAENGLTEKTKPEWKKFIRDIYEENFMKFISEEEFISRKSKFYRRCTEKYHYYITNPMATTVSIIISDDSALIIIDEENNLSFPMDFSPKEDATLINVHLENELSMYLYSLDGTGFKIGEIKDIIMIAAILPDGDDNMNFSSFIRSTFPI